MARLEAPKAALEQVMDRVRGARKGKKKDRQLSALGAAVFAGGFSFGVEQAGFRVAGHLELTDCELGATTSAQRWPVVLSPFAVGDGPSNKLHPRDLTTWISAAKLMKEDDAVPDFVYMNPPCSAFAKQGNRKGMDDDIMCQTIRCIDLCMELQPTVWAWELVEGVWDREGGKAFILEKVEEAHALGYRTYIWLTSSSLHGGYQNRVRFHFVASKVALDFEGVYEMEPDERKGWKTVGECLELLDVARAEGSLPNDEDVGRSALHALMPFLPPGGYLRELHDDLMTEHYRPRGKPWDGKSRAGATHVRARLDRYCPVVVGGQSIVHPVEPRWITPREAASIMGFPYDYKFSHGGKAYAEVGKGLCTHNAAFLARVVADGILRGDPALPGPDQPDTTEPTVLDWRDRVKVPVLSASREDKAAWFAENHPDLPVELAQQRKKGKPGRKAGGVRMPKAGERSVLLVGAPKEAVEACKKVGLDVVDHHTKDEEETKAVRRVIELMKTVKAAAWWKTDTGLEDHEGQWARGAAMALSVEVVEVNGDPLATAMACAKGVGMSDGDISAALLQDQDPLALLRAAMGSS